MKIWYSNLNQKGKADILAPRFQIQNISNSSTVSSTSSLSYSLSLSHRTHFSSSNSLETSKCRSSPPTPNPPCLLLGRALAMAKFTTLTWPNRQPPSWRTPPALQIWLSDQLAEIIMYPKMAKPPRPPPLLHAVSSSVSTLIFGRTTMFRYISLNFIN